MLVDTDAGDLVDEFPQLHGVTAAVDDSAGLVAHSPIASFFPQWPRIVNRSGALLFEVDERLDPARAAIDRGAVRVAVPVQRGCRSDVVIVSVADGGIAERIEVDGYVVALGWVADGVGAVVRRVDGAVDLLDVSEGRHVTRLLEPSAAHDISYWSYESGGQLLEGLLARNLDVETPSPIVIDLHGGPSPGLYAGYLAHEHWCGHGYLAFAPEFRTSGALGVEAMLAGERDLPDAAGVSDVDDVITGLRSLVEAGIADPDQVFVFGHSYGAILANRLARHGLGRAVVAHEPEVDRSMGYLLQGGNPITREMLGGHPWEQPDAYTVQSDLIHADQFETPVLVVVGDEHPHDGVALWTALRGRGKACELVIYAGEGHTLTRKENIRDLEHRSITWFRQHAPEAKHGGTGD